MIERYAEPLEIDVGQVLKYELDALVVWGIVNPFGPTLSAVALAREHDGGVERPLLSVMLNPFSQKAEVVGSVRSGPVTVPEELVRAAFSFAAGGCPTVVLASSLIEPSRRVPVYAEFLSRFAGGQKVLQQVEKYFGNPWDRISEEMRSAMASGLDREKRAATLPEDGSLESGEAVRLAELLLSESHQKEELGAFAYAWNGSIQQAPNMKHMTWAAYCMYLVHLTEACVFPEREST